MATLSTCATDDEATAVQDAFQAAIDTASSALSHYTVLAKDPTIPDEDRANYKAELDVAANDLKLIKAKQTAFLCDSPLGDVTPPEAPVVANLQNIAQQVAALAVANANGADILQLVSETLTIISQM